MTTINEVNAIARLSFVDGIIKGVPLGENAAMVIQRGTEYGGEIAKRKENFPVSVDFVSLDDLNRHSVEVLVEGLCSGRGLTDAINTVVIMAAAVGYQNTKARLDTADAETVLAEAIAASDGVNYIDDELGERLFAEINKIENIEARIGFARRVMYDERIVVRLTVPSHKKFIDNHLRLIS